MNPKIKKVTRVVLIIILLLVALGTGVAYLRVYLIAARQHGWGAVREEIQNLIALGDASRIQIETAFVQYTKAMKLAQQAMDSMEDPIEKEEARQMMEEAASKRKKRWEIVLDRYDNQLKYIRRRMLRISAYEQDVGRETAVELRVMKAAQTKIYEELLSAVYIVKPQEVWKAYLQVLDETKPDADCPLRIAIRDEQLKAALRDVNEKRAARKLPPVAVHTFGAPGTVDVDTVSRSLVVRFPSEKVVQTYLQLYRSPPDDLGELDLMRLRYMHRAVRERLDGQAEEFATEMRPVAKLTVTATGALVEGPERDRVERLIVAEIKDLIESGQMAEIVATRKVAWRERLPKGTSIDHNIVWPAVERLMDKRKLLEASLARLRGIILRPLRKYPEGQTQTDLYLQWLKDNNVLLDWSQRSKFLWVKRLRPVDILFNDPDGYMICSLLMAPTSEKPQGWRADYAVLFKQEIDTAWLPIGFQEGGPFVNEWLESLREKRPLPR